MLSGSQGCAQTLTCPRLSSASTSKPGGSQGCPVGQPLVKRGCFSLNLLKLVYELSSSATLARFPGLGVVCGQWLRSFVRTESVGQRQRAAQDLGLDTAFPVRPHALVTRTHACCRSSVGRCQTELSKHSPGYFILLLKLNIYRGGLLCSPENSPQSSA